MYIITENKATPYAGLELRLTYTSSNKAGIFLTGSCGATVSPLILPFYLHGDTMDLYYKMQRSMIDGYSMFLGKEKDINDFPYYIINYLAPKADIFIGLNDRTFNVNGLELSKECDKNNVWSIGFCVPGYSDYEELLMTGTETDIAKMWAVMVRQLAHGKGFCLLHDGEAYKIY